MQFPKHLGPRAKKSRLSGSAHSHYRSRLSSIEPLERREMLSVRPVFFASAYVSNGATSDSSATVAPLALPQEGPLVAPLAVAAVGPWPSIQETWSSQTLDPLTVSQTTGEKPQSKVWQHNGEWFAVMPNSSGTWVWRLDGSSWTSVLSLSTNSSTEADVKPVGELAHVLLLDGGSTQLASIEYVPGSPGSYQLWTGRATNANIVLPGSTETATLEVDTYGRMWVAYDNKSAKTMEVRYSDGDYSSWSSGIVVASGVKTDDISVIAALPSGQIGVLWSNQSAKRFGFRTHTDGASPTSWASSEVPAAISALNVGSGMADDHLSVAVASDGTLYAAVKTGYDSSGYAKIGMLVRHPNGSWDPMYTVSTSGTRGVIALNEVERRLIIAYTSSENGGKILYRETPIDSISFSPTMTLISGTVNNVTTTAANFVDEVVFLAGTGSKANGVLLQKPASGGGVTNQPPQVNAGTDLTIQLPGTANLNGTASDDGLPGLPLATSWSMVSGPGTVSFGNANATATTATFSTAGSYVLRLTANDGAASASDTLTVTVQAQPSTQTLVVNAGPDQSITLPATAALQASVSQGGVSGLPSGATVQWSRVSGPGTTSFANPAALGTTVSFSQSGSYVLRATVVTAQSTVSDDLTVDVSATPVTSDGVVGLWKFDEGSGSVAGDSSGNNNPGTLQGGAQFGSGHDGSGLALSGSNQRVVVPDTAALDITDSITLAAWIAPSKTGTQYVVKKSQYGSTDGYELSLSSSGKVFVRFNQDSSGNAYRLDSTASYPTDGSTWMHVVATYDGSTIRLYINGQLQSSKAASFTIGTNSNALGIGAEDGGYRPMRGGIDDALVTDRALSAAEILALYQGNIPSNPPPTPDPPPPTNLAPVVNAGADLNIQLPGAASLAGSVSDDGLPGNSPLSTTWSMVSGPGTVSFGNANATATTATFSTAGSYVLRLTANDGAASASDTLTVTVQAQPSTQTLVVNAGPDQSITLPATAALQASVSLGGVSGLPAGATVQWSRVSGPGTTSFANPAALGTTVSFSQSGSYVLRVTVVTAQSTVSDDLTVDVSATPVTSDGVVGLWKFDEGSGSVAGDSSGNDNQGTLQGGAQFGSGHDGSGLALSGSNQRVVVPDTAALDITGSITLAAWIAPSTTGTQYVVKKSQYGSSDGYELSLSSSGKVFVRFNQDSSGNAYRLDSTASYPTDGSTWMHVVATYDGSTIRLYINGQLQSSKAATFTIGTNSNALGIGAEDGGYRPMRGGIDDVLVANRALSADEVMALYQGT